jgi:PTS system mannose-specific IIC component/fructoselysine and glucoselysine-specific PTS system IIC component
MTVVQALLIAIMTWFLGSAEQWFAYPMISTPLILGALTGLILGDFTQGLIIGAQLQLVFLGIMGIGGTIPPDANTGTIIGTALAISTKQPPEIALTFAVPAAMMGSVLFFTTTVVKDFFNPLIERLVNEGKYKQLERLHFALAWLLGIPGALIIFFTLTIGSQFAQGILDAIPAWITTGLQVGAGFMPAVGFALLLRMMWNRKLGIYFFLGVLLAIYLHLDTLAVAAIGVVIAIIIFLENQGRNNQVAASKASEEGLFND